MLVLLLITSTHLSIRYKCVVLEVNIPYHQKRTDDLQVKRVMKIRCLKEYDKRLIPRAKMAQFGVISVRGPRHMSYALKQEIELLCEESCEK